MSRIHWPNTLDEVLAEGVTPWCPHACVFRELCPTHIQQGIAPLFASLDYAGPQDCLWWQKMVTKVGEELGPTPLPIDARSLRDLLGSLRRIEDR